MDTDKKEVEVVAEVKQIEPVAVTFVPLKKNKYGKKFELSKEDEVKIFKELAHKTLKQVGLEYGFDKYYPVDANMRTAVSNIVKKIAKAPDLYGVSQDAVDLVIAANQARSIRNNPRIALANKIEQESFKDKLDDIRGKTAAILLKKLDKIKGKKDIDEVSFRDLKDLLAMAIDKSRLLRGESTEHVLHLSKVDTEKMTPQDALALVMKAREAIIESKK